MKRFRDSLEVADKAIELEPDSGAAWVGRALALYRLRRAQDSVAAYHRARDLAPQDARSLNGLGTILLAASQPEDALIALDRAVELDPSDIDIVRNRLFALRDLRRYRQLWRDGITAIRIILRDARQ
jgi:superkiller protein 3